ncbi:tyrosine-type recombinase/integrase [Niabella aurantiaca]|uniref:tyrosine-type recombinase/integrase n=1 Tax=Niabella aurantiaca TaxID=379900 RepID=UPI00146E1BBC|nr:tyrosine-type recombinase/integrase [Niabella aurantiaca]
MLGNAGKEDFCKVYVRVTGGGADFRLPTTVKVKKEDFTGKKITGVHNRKQLNDLIQKERHRVETLILDAILKDIAITLELLSEDSGSRDKLSTYIKKYLEDTPGLNTRRTLKSIYKKLPEVSINRIGVDFLQDHEKMLRGQNLDQNTLYNQTKKVKQLLLSLIDKDKITNPKVIKAITKYSPPPGVKNIPEFLTIKEVNDWMTVTKSLVNPNKKTAGYYFLLSCHGGYRISDLYRFDYDKWVKDDILIVRANKNKKIVSIPIYKPLDEILLYCKNHTLKMSEKEFREFIRDVAKDIGINLAKRNITPHTGRHSFAMMMLKKGLNIDEVSELLGDTPDVARVYARILNEQIAGKIKKHLD